MAKRDYWPKQTHNMPVYSQDYPSTNPSFTGSKLETIQEIKESFPQKRNMFTYRRQLDDTFHTRTNSDLPCNNQTKDIDPSNLSRDVESLRTLSKWPASARIEQSIERDCTIPILGIRQTIKTFINHTENQVRLNYVKHQQTKSNMIPRQSHTTSRYQRQLFS